MDPKISISVNIAKWHSGSKRSRDSGVFRHTLLLGQVKHFGTALNTQSLHNAQMETDMGGGEWVKRGGPGAHEHCQEQIKWAKKPSGPTDDWPLDYARCCHIFFGGKGLMLACAWQICRIYIFISLPEKYYATHGEH